MNDDQEFSISAAGRPKTDYDLERFKRLSHLKTMKIDPGVVLEEVNFARINYRMVWTGKVMNIYNLMIAHRSIIGYLKKYIENWEYHIKITIKETEEK